MFSEQANIIIRDIFNQCLDNLSLDWGNINDESVYRNYKTESSELNDIFSKFHILLNNHFKEMNDRSKDLRDEYNTPRYWAEPSRQLLFIIEKIRELQHFLKDENIEINLIEKYEKHIAFCSEFLSRKCGSIIPINYKILFLEKYKPIFQIKTQQTFPNAKYLIFGADIEKPDIILKSVLDGDIEVINKNNILIYDTEIGDSLLYRDFDKWWEKVKNNYKDYKSSLNEIEQKISDFYKNNYRKDSHPVLIPQVYMHYDPKNQKFREQYENGKVLTFQRMDFLILYKGKRVIIEIDGKEHFQNSDKYFKQCKYDRDMKFLGYDVFRLGGAELTDNSDATVKEFFDNLYNYLEVT